MGKLESVIPLLRTEREREKVSPFASPFGACQLKLVKIDQILFRLNQNSMNAFSFGTIVHFISLGRVF